MSGLRISFKFCHFLGVARGESVHLGRSLRFLIRKMGATIHVLPPPNNFNMMCPLKPLQHLPIRPASAALAAISGRQEGDSRPLCCQEGHRALTTRRNYLFLSLTNSDDRFSHSGSSPIKTSETTTYVIIILSPSCYCK